MDSVESDNEEVAIILPPKSATGKPKQRSSVSAESYGTFLKKEDYIPRVIPKSEEQKSKILIKLRQAFMFSALDEKETQIVIDAMEEKKYK